MNQLCYICDELGSNTCSTCGSVCCDVHFNNIHKDECKIGNIERLSRNNIKC